MRVLCTNGLKTVMLDLGPDFERTIGTKVRVITWGLGQRPPEGARNRRRRRPRHP